MRNWTYLRIRCSRCPARERGLLQATEDQLRRMLRLEGELDQLQAAIRDLGKDFGPGWD